MKDKTEEYTKTEKKALGAFYSPCVLADYLASTIVSLLDLSSSKTYVILDPSTGNSSLLYPFIKLSENYNFKSKLIGIDIEKKAINSSLKRFKGFGNKCFVCADGLFPVAGKNSHDGWNAFKLKNCSEGIDIIISNPPWGAEKSQYKNNENEFQSAQGQYDIYDLFIETIIENLNYGGIYGIIVPDSIYCQEHFIIRKKLLTETTITHIFRLGEGFFEDVNCAVSIIVGIKRFPELNHSVYCSHLSNSDKKAVLNHTITLNQAIANAECDINQQQMLESNYSLITDVKEQDFQLMKQLESVECVKDYTTSQRGVELSKKGRIIKCSMCHKWMPYSDKVEITCPNCKARMSGDSLESQTIIGRFTKGNRAPIIVGEDIYRYNTYSKADILLDYEGINYKSKDLYISPKILIRKTGVGITAGIDYGDCLTNQVVYILRKRENISSIVTNEVIIAVLNSRITTYFLIKRYGSTGWKTHAYITQKTVGELPFPKIDTSNSKMVEILRRITNLVRDNTIDATKTFPASADAEIERCIAYLFGIQEEQYDIIFNAIQSVEQMIPFKRLLSINKQDIFHYGL